jgi:hypothetical protein
MARSESTITERASSSDLSVAAGDRGDAGTDTEEGQ